MVCYKYVVQECMSCDSIISFVLILDTLPDIKIFLQVGLGAWAKGPSTQSHGRSE